MSHVAERMLVKAPLASAGRFLAIFMAENSTHHGDGSLVVLPANGKYELPVTVLMVRHRPADIAPRYDVHWRAAGSEIFPVFNGALSILADDDRTAFWLVVAGSYVPPAGVGGHRFDAIADDRRGVATPRRLLAVVRDAIECSLWDEKRAKALNL